MTKLINTTSVVVESQGDGYLVCYQQKDGWYVLMLQGDDAEKFENQWNLAEKNFPHCTDEEIILYIVSLGYDMVADKVM